MRNSYNFKNLIFYMLIFLFCLGIKREVYAISTADLKVVQCEYSQEYKEWMLLSDEEKLVTEAPPMCDREANKTNIALPGVKNKVESMFIQDTKALLPTKYDIRTQNYQVSLKNQKDTAGCWTFTTTTALEIFMKKKYNLDFVFSVRHIEYASTRSFTDGVNKFGYNRKLDSGGNYFMTASYLANGMGPVLESELPFSEIVNPTSLSEIQNKTKQVDVNEIYLKYNTLGTKCSTSQIREIKELVYEYGGVTANINMIVGDSLYYYNKSNGAYYYNGSPAVNHAVTIVGWDDNYSKYNFNSKARPANNGAWIVQNSYGTTLGDGGYNYVSYEDLSICYGFMAIMDADQEIEDNSYIYDRLGYNSAYGFESMEGTQYTSGYTMNVFDKSAKSEILKEVTFGVTALGSYKIYYTEGNGEDVALSDMTLIGTGKMEHEGYMTHKLDNPLLIPDAVRTFSIIVHYEANDSTKPLAFSVQSNDPKYYYVSVQPTSSYMSYDADYWMDLSSYFNIYCIASIKAFTDDVPYTVEMIDYSVNEYNVDVSYSIKNTNGKLASLKAFDLNGKEVKINRLDDEVDIDGNLTKIKYKFDDNVETGKYRVVFYYNNSYIDELTVVIAKELYSDIYTINKSELFVIVSPKTYYNDFINNIYGSSGTIYRKNNTIVNAGIITTGMKIDGFTIIVKGDVTDDGFVKMNDIMKISNYIVENKGLDYNYHLAAADVTGDGKIKMNDVMKLSNYVVDGGTL